MGNAYNVIGVIGSLLILFGFYRTSIGRWSGKSLLYELDNLVGAALIGAYQIHLRAYITVLLNVVWVVVVVVALRGITSIVERRKPKPRSKA